MTKPKLTDWHLWSQVTRSVSPLPRKIPRKLSRKQNSPKIENMPEQRGGGIASKEPTEKNKTHPSWSPGAATHHVFSFHQVVKEPRLPTLEPKIHRRVRRGQLPIDASIDLHGLHQNEARSALYRFIDARLRRGDRTLLVITGKGLKKTDHSGRYKSVHQRGVLRHMLPIWLKEPAIAPMIAGFETSARQHGGEGAFYIRLKRGLL